MNTWKSGLILHKGVYDIVEFVLFFIFSKEETNEILKSLVNNEQLGICVTYYRKTNVYDKWQWSIIWHQDSRFLKL